MKDDFDETYYLAANPDVAMAVRAGKCPTAWDHFVRFGRAEGRAQNASATGAKNRPTKAHRREVAEFLRGNGVEVGALESPCPVPSSCNVTYVDRFSVAEARRRFPELERAELMSPDLLLDVNRDGLRVFLDESQDFVILSHVIEHVANPIACLEEMFRVTRKGGHVVLAVPDTRYNFEKDRCKTSFAHLAAEYAAGVQEVTSEHYVDLLVMLNPQELAGGVEAIERSLRIMHERAEHAHVWDSDSFRDFLNRAFSLLGIRARRVFEAPGDTTLHEYFVIFEKL